MQQRFCRICSLNSYKKLLNIELEIRCQQRVKNALAVEKKNVVVVSTVTIFNRQSSRVRFEQVAKHLASVF